MIAALITGGPMPRARLAAWVRAVAAYVGFEDEATWEALAACHCTKAGIDPHRVAIDSRRYALDLTSTSIDLVVIAAALCAVDDDAPGVAYALVDAVTAWLARQPAMRALLGGAAELQAHAGAIVGELLPLGATADGRE